MERSRANQVLAVIIAILSLLYLYEAFHIRRFPIPRPVDSDLFPKVLGGFMLVLAVLLFFQKPKEGEFLPLSFPRGVPFWKHPWTLVAGTALAIALYAVALRPVGFLPASAVLGAGLAWFYGYRNLPVNLAVSIGVPLALYLLLTRVMSIHLPTGILPF